MKRNIGLYICLLVPLLGHAKLKDATVTQNGVIYDEIEAVARRSVTGSRAELVPTLTRTYPAITNLTVRETITTVLGLNAMLDRKEAEAAKYREYLHTTFPKSRYSILLNPTTNSVACNACEGKGKRNTPCPTCTGSGKCPRCSGRGGIPRMGVSMGGGTSTRSVALTGGPVSLTGGTGNDKAQEICIICKGTGKCKTCDGLKTLQTPCTFCQGRGQIPAGNIRPVFSEMLLRLADLAFVAGQSERGRALFDGKWLDPDDFASATRQRREAYAYLQRVVTEADTAENIALARKTLEQVITKFPDKPVVWHAQQLVLLLNRDETTNQTLANIAEDTRMALAEATGQIPSRIGTVLDARRLNVLPPGSLLMPEATANLPINPLVWRIETPMVIGRTARVTVMIDLPSPSGLSLSTRWLFMMIYGKTGWYIAQIDPA